MSNDRIAQRAARSTARRMSRSVTLTPMVTGEFGQSPDTTRSTLTIDAIYTAGSNVDGLDAPKRSAGVKNMVVRSHDEIDIEPDVVSAMAWRPLKGDHVSFSSLSSDVVLSVAVVRADGQGGLRVELDRKNQT